MRYRRTSARGRGRRKGGRMRRVVGAWTVRMVLGSFFLCGAACRNDSSSLAQVTLDGGGFGQPNPMPGSPLGDGGGPTPINPGTAPTGSSNPGTPGFPGNPTTPATPRTP